MSNRVGVMVTAAFLGVLLTAEGSAGERSSVRSMGMARTHTAVARGLDAVGVNPADLAFPDAGRVTVSVLPAGLHIGSDLFTYGLYTEYFTGVANGQGRSPRYLTEEDKQKILAAFGETDPATRLDLDLLLFGASVRLNGVGRFALTVNEQVTGVAEIARGYAEFLLNGNTPGSDYRLNGTRLGGAWTREYALSFGGAIPPPGFLRSLAGGATVKLVHGFGYYEIQRFDTRFMTSEVGVLTGSVDFLAHATGAMPLESGYTLFPHPVGRGIGVDLGIAGEVSGGIQVGLSVTDIGRMRWSGDVVDSFADTTLIVDDPLLSDQRDAIEEVVRGRRREGRAFATPLPTAVHCGVAVDIGTMLGGVGAGLLVAADYHQGIVRGVRSTRTPRASLGVEFRPLEWLPLRSGVSFGGTDGVNLAMGIGVELGGFDFAVASENVTWLLQPGNFSYGSVAVGTRLRL
jgi:hypothetical protein